LRKAIDIQLATIIACSLQHLAVVAAIRGEAERAAVLLGFRDTMLYLSGCKTRLEKIA